MANHHSSKKSIRQIEGRTTVNRARLTRVRSSVKLVEEAIASGDADAAKAAFVEAQPVVMRGAQKGVLPPNRASRKLSRLSIAIIAMSA